MNKGSDMPSDGWIKDLIVSRKIDYMKDYHFHFFVFFNFGHVIQVSPQTFLNNKAQSLAERNLRSIQDFYIYMVIYKPF